MWSECEEFAIEASEVFDEASSAVGGEVWTEAWTEASSVAWTAIEVEHEIEKSESGQTNLH